MRYAPCLVALAAVFSISIPFSSAAPTANGGLRGRDASPEVVSNSYIVVFKSDANASAILAHEAALEGMMRRRQTGGYNGIGHKYNFAQFQAYHVEADPATIARISTFPEVDYIERNAVMRVTSLIAQTGSTYGLSRVSHRKLGASNYIYDNSACQGITAYVVDTGIYLEHEEFGGRAIWGANFINTVNTDENGHGTHVSGTLGGATYGVCKAVGLVAVKVADANGAGTYAGVIAGIQWAVNDAITKGASTTSIMNISLAGPISAAVNAAVAAAVAAGIPVVVAAGNEDNLASLDSPASEPSAITVGATTSTDARGDLSNYGPAVDIWAPGYGVLSAYIGSPTATMVLDGTSMATPHVAGLAAYFMKVEGFTTPQQVVQCLLTRATGGDITDVESGSPNLIAYNGDGY